jgi:hypothetical protein
MEDEDLFNFEDDILLFEDNVLTQKGKILKVKDVNHRSPLNSSRNSL